MVQFLPLCNRCVKCLTNFSFGSRDRGHTVSDVGWRVAAKRNKSQPIDHGRLHPVYTNFGISSSPWESIRTPGRRKFVLRIRTVFSWIVPTEVLSWVRGPVVVYVLEVVTSTITLNGGCYWNLFSFHLFVRNWRRTVNCRRNKDGGFFGTMRDHDFRGGTKGVLGDGSPGPRCNEKKKGCRRVSSTV